MLLHNALIALLYSVLMSDYILQRTSRNTNNSLSFLLFQKLKPSIVSIIKKDHPESSWQYENESSTGITLNFFYNSLKDSRYTQTMTELTCATIVKKERRRAPREVALFGFGCTRVFDDRKWRCTHPESKY